jgi:hypothetical protein
VFEGLCEPSFGNLIITVVLPPGAPFAPQDGKVIFDFTTYPVSPDGTAVVTELVPSALHLALYVYGGHVTLAAIVGPEVTAATVDASSSADSISYVVSGGFLFPPDSTTDLVAQLDQLPAAPSVASDIVASVVAGDTPFAPADSGRAAMLQSDTATLLTQVMTWTTNNPITWPPDSMSAPAPAAAGRAVPAGVPSPAASALLGVTPYRAGGFSVAPSLTNGALALQITNVQLRAGVASVNQTAQQTHTDVVPAVDVDPASFSLLQTFADIFSPTRASAGVTQATASMSGIPLSTGTNTFDVVVVAPGQSFYPGGIDYPTEYNHAFERTIWLVYGVPLLQLLFGQVVEAAFGDTAWECMENVVSTLWDADWAVLQGPASLQTVEELLIDLLGILTKYQNYETCLQSVSFWKTAAAVVEFLSDLRDIWDAAEMGTEGILGFLSYVLNASTEMHFTVNACVPSCGACGSDGCGGQCTDSCGAGTTCNSTTGTCVSSCTSNFCSQTGHNSGSWCNGTTSAVDCGVSGGCTVQTGSQPCSCGCSGGTCTTCATCGDGVKNGSDQCDGTDFGGQSCTSLGYASGTLQCNSNCTYNFAKCCSANASRSCSGGNVYELDSCGNPETLLQACNGCGCSGSTCSSCTVDQCTSGACCNTTNHPYQFSSPSVVCGSATSYRCTSAGCGNTLQSETTPRYCSGGDSTCDGSWGTSSGWQTTAFCSSTQTCNAAVGSCESATCQPAEVVVAAVPYYQETEQTSGFLSCSDETSDAWHDGSNTSNPSDPEWQYVSNCPLPSSSNAANYTGYLARWPFTVLNTASYDLSVYLPDMTTDCGFPASKFTAGATYVLAVLEGSQYVEVASTVLNQSTNMGKVPSLWLNQPLTAGVTYAVFIYDNGPEGCRCWPYTDNCDGAAVSARIWTSGLYLDLAQ